MEELQGEKGKISGLYKYILYCSFNYAGSAPIDIFFHNETHALKRDLSIRKVVASQIQELNFLLHNKALHMIMLAESLAAACFATFSTFIIVIVVIKLAISHEPREKCTHESPLIVTMVKAQEREPE